MENDIKIEKLQSIEQWAMYKFQIRVLMNASDLWEIVSGDEAIPVIGGVIKTEADLAIPIKEWTRKDRKAQKIIVMSVGNQPMLHIMNCTTAREMWIKLENVYEQKSKASLHLIQQRFYSFAKDPLDNMAIHISKLQAIVQQLRDLGEMVSPTMVVTKILMTLPASFNHFFSAWGSPQQQISKR